MDQFPPAVPEIPVSNIHNAVDYYVNKLGFTFDWGNEEGGIGGISRGDCRIFLTNPEFRKGYGNVGPVMTWLNVNNRKEVTELHEEWKASQTTIVSPPEEKPWKLFEFTASDPDGNLFRVFYDFGGESNTRNSAS